jgi:hypothetical protein
MQWIKIQIPDREQRMRAFMEMTRRGRIDCYEGGVYMVPEPALDLLAELGVTFHELGRGGFDYAIKTLRDTQEEYARRNRAGKSGVSGD